jgi:hypothetical protein
MNQIGFVAVLHTKPAAAAEQIWTGGESGDENRSLHVALTCEYVQK